MKSLKQIREAKSGGKEAYQKFFNSLLKKFGVSSPAELKGDDKKKFYDELDAGWESDDPNDKNERYEDPDNLDPETDVDSDEDMADKAASKLTASYDKKKMNAGYIKSGYGYKKESVSHPKPLSIIRQNKLSDDALEEAYDMNEKMVMCEHCGKMHEEGACGDMKEYTGMSISKSVNSNQVSTALKNLKRGTKLYVQGKPQKGMRTSGDVISVSGNTVKIKPTASNGPTSIKVKDITFMDVIKEELDEANRFSKKLNKPSKKIFDLALAAIRRNNITDKKEKDEYVDDVAGVSLTPKEVELVKKAIKLESVDEMFSTRSIGLKGASKRSRDKARGAKEMPPVKGAKLGKAYPVLDAATQRKVKAIAKKHSGNMEKALKDIEKLKKGLGDNPDVMDILKKANETYDYGSDKAVKAAKKKTPGQKNEAVDVDRRTKGFKEAMKRAEAAKKKREAYKKKKEAKKDQAELDARYDYDGEVDTVLAAANSVMLGKKLPEDAAANSVASGNVDMTPHVKKKKKKELMARRNY